MCQLACAERVLRSLHRKTLQALAEYGCAVVNRLFSCAFLQTCIANFDAYQHLALGILFVRSTCNNL